MIEEKLLDILACPVCKEKVSCGDDALICDRCLRRYPIREGIPVMLIEEAEIEEKENE